VSGDYYFITSKGNKLIVSVADCTGHGVPGAFMSILGISFLNEIISKENIFDSSDILNRLRDNIINALNQGKEEKTKDGMDMVLCIFDFEKNIIEFSGANNPLYHIRKGILYEYKGDKMPIGLYDNIQPFSKTIIPIEKGDTFYMFSDGYADQFGGPEGKKFKYKQLKELLLSIQEYPMPEQGKIIEKTIDDWKRDYFQVDDMLMIGIKY
jgi:serine phosphatase RsbU (regulator of sigma subunit)